VWLCGGLGFSLLETSYVLMGIFGPMEAWHSADENSQIEPSPTGTHPLPKLYLYSYLFLVKLILVTTY